MSRVYGKWVGKPNGTPEDPDRCVEEIQQPGKRHTEQCGNPRGHGPNGDLCEEHAPYVAPAPTTTPAPKKVAKKKVAKKRTAKKKPAAQ